MKGSKLRRRFTLWYIRRGYGFGYDTSSGKPKALFNCPIWVRPLLFLFSPSIYGYHCYGKMLVEGFLEGVSKGEKEIVNGHEKGC